MSLFNRSSTSVSGPARTINLTKDPGGASAINLSKVREDGHVDLAKRADKAGIALSKRGLAGIRAQAVLVLDHSGSMYNDYANGKVQTLVERVLGFALQIDVDGTVPVIPFDSRVRPSVDVTVGNYSDAVNKQIWKQSQMGTTNLAAALEAVRDLAKVTDEPIFCAVVTDGSPDDRTAATKLVCELAGYPVFLKFLALDHVAYLDELDDNPGPRLLDNVDSKPDADGPAILDMTDLQFADAMATEWDSWIEAATKAGVLA